MVIYNKTDCQPVIGHRIGLNYIENRNRKDRPVISQWIGLNYIENDTMNWKNQLIEEK